MQMPTAITRSDLSILSPELAQIGSAISTGNVLELGGGNNATYVKLTGANTIAFIGNNDNTKADLQLGNNAASTLYGVNGSVGTVLSAHWSPFRRSG